MIDHERIERGEEDVAVLRQNRLTSSPEIERRILAALLRIEDVHRETLDAVARRPLEPATLIASEAPDLAPVLGRLASALERLEQRLAPTAAPQPPKSR